MLMLEVIIRASKRGMFVIGLAAAFAFAAIDVAAQEDTAKVTGKIKENEAKAEVKKTEESVKTEPAPLYTNYRDVAIGMNMDKVRETLGKAKSKSKSQDFYLFSDKESAQIYYDKEGKVKAISVTYFGDGDKTPTPVEVLGMELEKRANGSIYKMVRYPQAGFWVSYSRTAGDKPIISITMQKMRVMK